MAITPNLKITLPVSDQDAQKVPVYNEAHNEHDKAASGMITIDVSGTGNMTAFTRAQTIFKVIKFIGTLTGNRVVFIPVSLGSARVFLAWNATTGAFTLTIKTTAVGSTGIDVSQDAKAFLFHDDTHVYYAGPEV